MPPAQLQPQNRFNLPVWALWGLVGAGCVAYLLLFFSQPSVLGITDAQGIPVPRFVDFMQILLPEQLLQSMAGNGRFHLGVIDRLPILAGIVAWMGVAAWIGWPLATFSRRSRQVTSQGSQALTCESLTQLERISLATLVGLSLLSTMTLLIGLVGGLGSRWALLFSLGLAAMVSGFASGAIPQLATIVTGHATWHLWSKGTGEGIAGAQLGPTRDLGAEPQTLVAVWLMRLVPVGTSLLALLMLYGCLMPPWEFDVVEYHLQAPKEAFQSGVIQFNQHNIYANMPLGSEMHTLAAMTMVGGADGWWWGGLIGKGITGSFSLLAAALLGGFVARRLGTWSGWTAAGLLLSTPGNAHVSMAGLIDMVIATYLLSATILVADSWPRLRKGTVHFRELFVISLLAGSAAACKYTGVVFVTLPIFMALMIGLMLSRNRYVWGRWVLAGSLGILLSCAPWYAKNYAWTGNPVFPLATSLFGASGLSESQIERWQLAHRVPGVENQAAYTWGAAWDSIAQVLWKSSFLPPTLMMLFGCGAVVATFSLRRSTSTPCPNEKQLWKWEPAWILLTVWIVAVWWLATHRIDRFWLPVLPLICAVASAGATWIGWRLSVSLATAAVLLGMLYGGLIMVSGAIGDNRFFVSLHDLRVDAGDTEFSGRLPPAVGWANEVFTKNDQRLLLIGEARAYDFRMPIVYATCFDRNMGEEWLRDQTPMQQHEHLKQAGISHVLINWNELQRYRSPGNYGFSDWPQRDDVSGLVESGVLVPYACPVDGIGVFEVAEEL